MSEPRNRTKYSYDSLNRLQSISYNVNGTTAQATPMVSFTYGTSPSLFNNGMLTKMTDGVGYESYLYNALEQLTQLQKVISTTTYTTNYQYNVAGELTQITYPSGRVVQQSMDAIGRLCEVAPSTSGCNLASSPFATGYGYNTASELTGFKYGNGIFASFGFSSDRLQLNCLDYSTTNRNGSCAHDSTTKFGLTYSYGVAGSNNGQISGITDSVDSGRNATYTYDSLYRLSTAVTTGSTNYPAWGLKQTYDRYGNRWSQTIISGCTGITCPQPSVAMNPATNQITGSSYSYDLSGNMTNDGINTIVYDAENRAASSSGTFGSGSYTYDGNGLRVIKKVSGSTTTVYIFSGSKVIAEYDNGAGVGSPSREYVYGGAALLAKIDSSGTKYYHQDQISNRLVTDSNGNTSAQMGHFPFGEPWYNTTGDKLLFTTYERDSESANDYALARYYVNRLSPFSSPDSRSGNTGDPQSLNRYAYTQSDPIDFADPTGMYRDGPGQCSVAGDSCGGGGGGSDLGLDDFAWIETFWFSLPGDFSPSAIEELEGDSLDEMTYAATQGEGISFLGVDLMFFGNDMSFGAGGGLPPAGGQTGGGGNGGGSSAQKASQLNCAKQVVNILFQQTGLSALASPQNVSVGTGNWISFTTNALSKTQVFSLQQSNGNGDLSFILGNQSFFPDPENMSQNARSLTTPSLHLERLDTGNETNDHVDAFDLFNDPLGHAVEAALGTTLPPCDLLSELLNQGY